MIKIILSICLLAIVRGATAVGLPSLVVKGSKFFYPNGTEFFFKGVAYQMDAGVPGASTAAAGYIDPLADPVRCKLDVPLLQELDTNIIRAYQVDPTADHSECMALLQDAGIYVLSDLSNPQASINRDSPAWNVDLFTHYQSVVDELAHYSNVIGFFVGNEVTNNVTDTMASAFVKAAIRDVKAYIKSKNYHWMGVGYAADDSSTIRNDVANYFNCGSSEDSVDFYGYNVYSWCGVKGFEDSGYNRIIDFFTGYSVPVFFAEYGCNQVPGGGAGRIWDETTALYTANMSAVIAGGIVYEYFNDVNDYGIVSVTSNFATPVKEPDFAALQQKITAVNPPGTLMNDYNPSLKARDCPSDSVWKASSTLPPTPNADTCSCMAQQAECVPASGLQLNDYGSIFGYICGQDASLCDGISANATSGVYGSYSPCNATDQLTYVLNAYYQQQGKASTACDFNSSAQVQTPSKNNCGPLPAATTGGSGSNSSSSGGSSSDEDSGVTSAPIASISTLGSMVVLLVYILS